MAEPLETFTIRQRNIHPLDFILFLIAVLGGDGHSTTQADLHRKFNLNSSVERHPTVLRKVRATRCAATSFLLST